MTGFDLIPLIKSFGYLGIFGTILLENGVPLLFFLPGDSLLLTAGFLAAQGYLSIEILVVGGFVTAILGYMLGYHLGHRSGRRVIAKGGGRFVKPEHLEKTKGFYNKYGAWSLIIARFVPLRACVCFLAGAAEMSYRTFMICNVIGALAWGVALPLIGYYAGRLIPIGHLEQVILVPVLCAVFMLVMVPVLAHLMHRQSKNGQSSGGDPAE